MNEVKLIGLDFGTTTSSAVMARAKLVRNTVTGRTEFSEVSECYRSGMAFTPIDRDRLDEAKAVDLLDSWLAAGLAPGDKLFGGGAMLTGLTARAENAATLVALIRKRIGDAVVSRADDPRTESWLAFMGNCARLSRQHPRTRFINLDIGGGTTNIAHGMSGEVHGTGCLFVGARHIQVEPGTYRIVRLSEYAGRLLEHCHIVKREGDELTAGEVDAILDNYLQWLKAAVVGNSKPFEEPVAKLHQQVALNGTNESADRTVITLSGGVGELVYAIVRGQPLPCTTAYGDLGIDLARRIVNDTPWIGDLHLYVPEGGGRATSFGLLRHSTQVSGSTCYLSDSTILPLRDLPIFGTLSAASSCAQWLTILSIVQASTIGGCVQIEIQDCGAESVKALATNIAESLIALNHPAAKPLVLIVSGNVGKALGHYITQWGARPFALVVIDEVAVRDAQFVHLGRLYDCVVPVSFYGLQS